MSVLVTFGRLVRGGVQIGGSCGYTHKGYTEDEYLTKRSDFVKKHSGGAIMALRLLTYEDAFDAIHSAHTTQAAGHSARSTYQALCNRYLNVTMEVVRLYIEGSACCVKAKVRGFKSAPHELMCCLNRARIRPPVLRSRKLRASSPRRRMAGMGIGASE